MVALQHFQSGRYFVRVMELCSKVSFTVTALTDFNCAKRESVNSPIPDESGIHIFIKRYR